MASANSKVWTFPKGRHGKASTPEYWAWVAMIERCHRVGHQNYPNYGARGIVVCERWRAGFSNFLNDVGTRPSSKHSLDRYPNNDGNYEPGNVRWATQSEQASNTRQTHFVEIDGVKKTITQWAAEKGFHQSTISHRIARGMSEREAILTPPRFGGRRASKRTA